LHLSQFPAKSGDKSGSTNQATSSEAAKDYSPS
jgi:hypothetical protein